MSAPTDIYVSPSTSLILIRNVSTPTNIYLNSFNVPNFNVSVRDTTGSSRIQVSSVYLSTIGSARFADGSFLYTLNQPYGFVNLGFRNSSFWQVLHTSGQAPTNSAANVNSLHVSTSFISLLSTSATNISSLLIENIRTTNAIVINGPFVITNLSAPGIVTVQSSLNVYGDVLVDKQLFVSGTTLFQSSLTISEILPVSSVTRVFSSVGVAGTLSVGGIVTVGSTLFTQSTNSIQSLQIQKSSQSITTTVQGNLQLQNLLSSFLSLTVMNNYIGCNNPVTIQQDVSTISGSFSTQSMDIRDAILSKGNVSTIEALLLSSVSFGSSLAVQGPVQISTGFMTGGSFLVSSLSTRSFSTLSSFSTGSLFLTSTASISSGLSTLFLDILDRLSVGNTLQTVATVSSMTQTRVKDTVFVNKNAYFDFLHISSGFKSDTLFVGGSISTFSSEFQNLSTLGTFYTFGNVTVNGDVNVFSNVTVENNIDLLGPTLISSISAQSYLLSSVYITTSSPSVAFTASTLIVSCNANTKSVLINSSPIVANSAFASTTQFVSARAENIRVATAETSNLFWGPRFSTNLAFSLNAPSLFPKGLSAQTILANSLTANKFIGSFLGDGVGLSNIALTFQNLSAITTYASTVSTQVIYTSSLYASSFQNRFLTTVVSSFQSPTLAIEGIGYSSRYDKNQILLINSNLYCINNTVYIDTLQNRVGINISSPQVDLDISGGIYTAGGFIFSTIQDYYVSTVSTPLTLSTILTGYAVIRDAYINSNVIMLKNPNTYNSGTPIPNFLLTSKTTYAPPFTGILGYASSIGLQNGMYVMNNTQRVGVNSLASNLTGPGYTYSFREPQYEFEMTRNMLMHGTAHVSTLNMTTLLTKTVGSPSLYMQLTPPVSTNTFSTTVGTLYMNSGLLVLSNSTIPKIGINTTTMVSQGSNSLLDVNGSAYFSTVEITRLNTVETLSFASRLL